MIWSVYTTMTIGGSTKLGRCKSSFVGGSSSPFHNLVVVKIYLTTVVKIKIFRPFWLLHFGFALALSTDSLHAKTVLILSTKRLRSIIALAHRNRESASLIRFCRSYRRFKVFKKGDDLYTANYNERSMIGEKMIMLGQLLIPPIILTSKISTELS